MVTPLVTQEKKWPLLMWGWWQKQSKVLTKGTSLSGGGGHAVCKEPENKETALGFPSALPQVVLHFVREGRFSSSASQWCLRKLRLLVLHRRVRMTTNERDMIRENRLVSLFALALFFFFSGIFLFSLAF